MRFNNAGGRAWAALVPLCLSMVVSMPLTSSAAYRDPVNPPEGGGPLAPCNGCKQTATTSGSASSGAAQINSGSTQFNLTYGIPSDGTTYSGTIMTQVVNPDGSVTVNTFSITDYGNGTLNGYASAFNDAAIPIGGRGSITINETNSAGASFSAGWVVDHFGQ